MVSCHIFRLHLHCSFIVDKKLKHKNLAFEIGFSCISNRPTLITNDAEITKILT